MPNGDSNVALSVLGSLANVATADAGTLVDVPIRSTSKDLIRHFFGGMDCAGTSDDTRAVEDETKEQSNRDEFGEFDDSELMKFPDPSNARGHEPNDFQTPKNQSTANNFQSFPGKVDFTPMVPFPPSTTQPSDNISRTSIFPESFTVGETMNFPSNYRNKTHGAVGGMQQQYPYATPGTRQGEVRRGLAQAENNYWSSRRSGSLQRYQDTTQGSGSFSRSAQYHQQFM